MTLNTLQSQAADGLLEFATKREHTFALLLGPAGSGKTFTISHVIKHLEASKRPIIVACPTHKAKSVLVKSLARYGISVSATTVSALIGKAPSTTDDPDEEGQARWMRGGGDTLRPDTLLVLDEISMIDVADMRAVKRATEAAQAQAILTGDFAQLRPVKGTSIVDAVEKIPVRFKLSEVMRSGSQGIVAVSKSVRTTGQIDLDAIDGQTVFAYHSADKFEGAFVSTPEAVAIAYTNKRVSELNRLKRRAIYGADVHDFMPNESLILTEAPFFIWARGATTGKYSSVKVADNNSQLIVKYVGFMAEAKHPFSEKAIPYYELSLHNPETGLTFDAKAMTFDIFANHLKPALDDALGASVSRTNRHVSSSSRASMLGLLRRQRRIQSMRRNPLTSPRTRGHIFRSKVLGLRCVAWRGHGTTSAFASSSLFCFTNTRLQPTRHKDRPISMSLWTGLTWRPSGTTKISRRLAMWP